MTAYLTVERFKLLSTIPAGFVDLVETIQPGFTQTQLEYWSRWIDTRLAKRYVVPFQAPVSDMIEGWLARLVTPRVWSKRGVDPNDEQWLQIKADGDSAAEEIKEAADGQLGLFDLPLRDDTAASGISRGAPLVYSEASPYVHMTLRGQRGFGEDNSGNGTSG